MTTIKLKTLFVLAELNFDAVQALVAPLTLDGLGTDGNQITLTLREDVTEQQVAQLVAAVNQNLCTRLVHLTTD